MAPSQGDLFCTRQLKLYLSIYYVIFLLSHIACDLLQRVLSILFTAIVLIRLLWWLSGEESACQCRSLRFNPWVRNILQRRKWLPPLVFFPGKLHRQKSLVGYSPWVAKEWDTTQQLNHQHHRFNHTHGKAWKITSAQ